VSVYLGQSITLGSSGSPVKVDKSHHIKSWEFDALSNLGRFATIASISAAVADTTIQDQFVLPHACKIAKVAVYCSAIDDISGGNLFNIALGAGSYHTGGVYGSQTYTVSGTPGAGDTITATINGHAVVYTVSGTPSTTTVAAGLRDAINADTTANLLVSAAASGAVVTIKAIDPGVAGNAITTTASATPSGGSTALAAGGATLVNGAEGTAITVPPNDNEEVYGYPTVFGAAGQALFGTDVAFNTTNFPGLAVATGGSGLFVPTHYDAVIPALTLLTLRVETPPNVGSITNLSVSLLGAIIDTFPNGPGDGTSGTPGLGF
jgi:hypothetical protein